MTPEEIIDLLTFAAAVDGRDVGKADVAAWHVVIGDLNFGDAQQALVEHYQESRFRVMPADVRQRVKAIRRDRLERAVIEAPEHELADQPGRYKAELDRRIREIAGGKDVNRVLANDRRQLRAVEGERQ
jgi:hypothetical protein